MLYKKIDNIIVRLERELYAVLNSYLFYTEIFQFKTRKFMYKKYLFY